MRLCLTDQNQVFKVVQNADCVCSNKRVLNQNWVRLCYLNTRLAVVYVSIIFEYESTSRCLTKRPSSIIDVFLYEFLFIPLLVKSFEETIIFVVLNLIKISMNGKCWDCKMYCRPTICRKWQKHQNTISCFDAHKFWVRIWVGCMLTVFLHSKVGFPAIDWITLPSITAWGEYILLAYWFDGDQFTGIKALLCIQYLVSWPSHAHNEI